MSIIKKKVENLKPGKDYLVTVRAKNPDLNIYSDSVNSIVVSVPQDSSIPDAPSNLALYASYETVMFVFDNSLEKDVFSYKYELYNQSQISGTVGNYTITGEPYREGYSSSNVFTVAVDNSSSTVNSSTGVVTTVNKSYYGRIKSVDTSKNESSWSSLVLTDANTPLINSQFINSLTASKITAGTIGAHEIILTQSGAQTSYTADAGVAVIRSSDYQDDPYSGWIIKGSGEAEFGKVKVNGPSVNRIVLSTGENNEDNLISLVKGSGTPEYSTKYTTFYIDGEERFSIADGLSWSPQDGLTVTGKLEANSGRIGGIKGWQIDKRGYLFSGTGSNRFALASGSTFITGDQTDVNTLSVLVDDEYDIFDAHYSSIYIKINRSQLPVEYQASPAEEGDGTGIEALIGISVTFSGFTDDLSILNNKDFNIMYISENNYELVDGVAESTTILGPDELIIVVYGEDQNLIEIHDDDLEGLYSYTSNYPKSSFKEIQTYTDENPPDPEDGPFYRMWAGAVDPRDASFSLDSNGNLKVNSITVTSTGSTGGFITVGGGYNGAPTPKSIWLSDGTAPPSGTGNPGDIWIMY